ncbi:MAG: exopolyphosphatase [Altibacter sp.]|uniref:Ppx/GppA phosphatase family protein n=1 Tax=Altibacter sp. TaxID=2024823 RepID=UPI001D24FCC5|nr:exopolyphosphatase [Altibacter sp.]MBZ0326663.1 exopolyphosphatase [Altibacter sp.]
MLHLEKYGAIDIGSNAIRLLVATVVEQEGKQTLFKKTSLVRVPIRLGADVFLEGKISDTNAQRMIDAMNAFRLLMQTHNVKRYKACATSAMREAANGQLIADIIYKEAEIFINIIDGKDEAAIIASTDLKSLIQNDRVFLYVDVGGGSTEFTIFADGHTITSKSFKLGTVRLLNDMVEDTMWQQMEEWIKAETKQYKKIDVIGSGGNINSIYKNSGKKIGKPLSYFYLASFYDLIRSYTLEERIVEMDMNPDRADVIVPATRIYLSSMKWAGAKSIFVPKIGLSDGIIKSLYNEKMARELEVK